MSPSAALSSPIRVAVSGALGKMGRQVVQAVLDADGLELVAAVDLNQPGNDVGTAIGLPAAGVSIKPNLTDAIGSSNAQVCVDFTHPDAVFENAQTLLNLDCSPVVGTTGLSDEQLEALRQLAEQKSLGILVVPNFALGAVLMMRFAQQASKYFDHAEIIEYHHNQKADAPSGTAIKTAQLMAEANPEFAKTNAPEHETIPGSRGGQGPAKLQVHSVRLPGYVAHQEVIFGSPGQTLTIRHDSIERSCYMPGVVFGVRKVVGLTGLVYGLENILD